MNEHGMERGGPIGDVAIKPEVKTAKKAQDQQESRAAGEQEGSRVDEHGKAISHPDRHRTSVNVAGLRKKVVAPCISWGECGATAGFLNGSVMSGQLKSGCERVFEPLESRRLLSASISGTAFVDANLDGVRQSSETGLTGEKVYVDANNNGKLDSGEKFATSGASGAYTLSGLDAGKYRLRALPPTGWRYDWTGPAGYFYDVTVTSTSAVT